VCGTKNFASVRLYSAPQLHRTIVAILGICAYGTPKQGETRRHNQTDLRSPMNHPPVADISAYNAFKGSLDATPNWDYRYPAQRTAPRA
jgi:hypothetical protein